MRKNYPPVLSILFLLGVFLWMYVALMPRWSNDEVQPLSEFDTHRALSKIKVLSATPHYTGSQAHKKVASYLESELRNLGLETQVQEGYAFSEKGLLVKCRNIIGRKKGRSGKALMLLSHYDSAPHSYSPGAADDGSGIAAILEGMRAYLHNKPANNNDIIVLFSDAEELGLNGASLFVKEHPWAKSVGLVINFEARGTSGPSYMLMETVGGNSGMVSEFAQASPDFPVSNSLMYSVYKMMPNDTDLTVFREQGKIPGFNFAFIDDHFNYHTAQDDVKHLDLSSLEHQGSYLMPLLNYFSNSDLNKVKSKSEHVYFNGPLFFVYYPFSWNIPLLMVAFVLFAFLVFIGMGKRILFPASMGRGFALMLASLVISGALAYLGWELLKAIYPQYQDVLHGFFYNGHSYIWAFTFLTLSVCFAFYWNVKSETSVLNYSVAPLFLWLVITLVAAMILPGAGFFILPIFSGLIVFGYFIISQKTNNLLNLGFSLPALIIFCPLILMFPIGLGLKSLYITAILTSLTFTLLLPVFASFKNKAVWSILLLLVSLGFFVHAQINSKYEKGKAKPNSLLYFYDSDADLAYWATYDKNLDLWTSVYLNEKKQDAKTSNALPIYSKYGSGITYTAEAHIRDIKEPMIEFIRDSVVGSQRHLQIRITPNRIVNRCDIFLDEKTDVHNLRANGKTPAGQKSSLFRRSGKQLVSYYVVNNEPLELSFSISKDATFDLEMLESSFDLMSNPQFRMAKRAEWMIPTPFVLTDAVVIRKKIRPQPKVIVPIPVKKNFALPEVAGDTIPDPDDGL